MQMKRILLTLGLIFGSYGLSAQVSSAEMLQVLQGNYDPNQYAASQVIRGTEQISCEVLSLVSADSIHHNLEILSNFGTRHTWSDTVSNTRGIGAARRWIRSKFQGYSSANEGRLLSGYFTFDITNNTCGPLFGTKNVLGVLPGADTSDKSVILLMAHMDSRCEGRCDTACLAPGSDDNGSGTILVMELARILSRYTFDHTVVFMLTQGEEQGLLGARAFSDYCVNNGISIKGVLNNDIVGGVICGQTASPPGCSPAGDIDSLRVRMYANPLSDRNEIQGYARGVKLNYEEKILPHMPQNHIIELVDQEDRSGRGGDHIAFRENDFLNLRFSSAHEHGNGNPLGTPNYQDHQHTSNDIIGEDFDNDGEIDSFYVDMNYLARNAMINGTAAAMLASAPATPQWSLKREATGLRVEIEDANLAFAYRVGVKGFGGSEYDSIYRFQGSSFLVPSQQANQIYMVGVAALDSNGLMSPFSQDQRGTAQANTPAAAVDNLPFTYNCGTVSLQEYQAPRRDLGIQLLDPRPNPTQDRAQLLIWVKDRSWEGPAEIVFSDYQGRELYREALDLKFGDQSIDYQHRGQKGLFYYWIEQGGKYSEAQRLLVN